MPTNIFSLPRNPLWTGVWGEWTIVNFCSVTFPKGRFSGRNVKTVFNILKVETRAAFR